MSHNTNKPFHEEWRKQAEIVYSLLSMLNSNANSDQPPLVALLHDKNAHTKQEGGLQSIALVLKKSNQEFGSDCCNENVIKLRLQACRALTNLTYGFAKNKSILCSIDGFVATVVEQLKSPNEELRKVAASVLRNLSWKADADAKIVMKESGMVAGLLTAGMEAEKESTLKCILDALWNISAHSVENKADICDFPGSLEFITSLLTYSSPSNSSTIIECAGGILRNISIHVAVHEQYRMVLRRQNCFEILLKQLQSDNCNIVSNACGSLWNLSARCGEDQQTLWRLGAVRLLGNLVDSEDKSISIASSAALKNLLLYKSNTSSLFTSCSSSPTSYQAQPVIISGAGMEGDVPDRDAVLLNDDSVDEPIDFSTKFKEDVVENDEHQLNGFMTADTKRENNAPCIINNNSNNGANVTDNNDTANFIPNNTNFTYPIHNVKDQRLMQLQMKAKPTTTTKKVPDVGRQVPGLCQVYKVNSGYSSPTEQPKLYCTEDTPDGFSIVNGSMCAINDIDCSRNDYFGYSSNDSTANFNVSNANNFTVNNHVNNNNIINNAKLNYNPQLNKPQSVSSNQILMHSFNLNSNKVIDYYEEAKDEPIDYSVKYQEILPDKYPSKIKWLPCESYLPYKQQVLLPLYESSNTRLHNNAKPTKSHVTSLPSGSTVQKADAGQKENFDIMKNKCLSAAQSKISPGSACSPNDTPMQFCTEGTPIGYSRASSLSSLSVKSSETEHDQTVGNKVHVEKIAESSSTLPSIQENEALNITPMVSKQNNQNTNKNTGKSSGSSDNNSHHNGSGGSKTVKFDETIQTPMMFSRCSSLGSLSSFDARSVHSSVISEYSRRASGIVSPSDLPDSPGDTMPPSPKTGKQHERCPSSNRPRGETASIPVGEQGADVKNDSDCSLSDNGEDYDDDLLSEVIQAAMPKSRKHSRVTYEVVNNNYSDGRDVKMMMARKPFPTSSDVMMSAGNNKAYLQPQSHQHVTNLDSNQDQDTLKVYAEEGTPFEISRVTSLSDISIDDSAAGKKFKKDSNQRRFISVQPQKTFLQSQNALLEDSFKTYCLEGTPVNFSRNDSLSSLGSKDFSSPGKSEAEIHPKLKKMFINSSNKKNAASAAKHMMTSTPSNSSRHHQMLGDEVLRYAVEGTPDKVPPISYEDTSLHAGANNDVIDDKITFDNNQLHARKSSSLNNDRTSDNGDDDDDNKKGMKSSSSSSLGDSDDDDDDDDSPIKNDLLQECINAALPKSKSRNLKQKINLAQAPKCASNKSIPSQTRRWSSEFRMRNNRGDGATNTPEKINGSRECGGKPQSKPDSLKKARFITNALHEATTFSEEDDCSTSGHNTEANNTVIFKGSQSNNGGEDDYKDDEEEEEEEEDDDGKNVEEKGEVMLIESPLIPSAVDVSCASTSDAPTTGSDECKNNESIGEDLEADETTTTSAEEFSIDNINLLSSRSLNLPGLILTEENSNALNLSPSLLSKSAESILSVEKNHSKNKSSIDFNDFSELIDDFYNKTRLQDLEGSRFDMKSANNAETESTVTTDRSEFQSSSLSSSSSLPNSFNIHDGAETAAVEKKQSKNKLLNFFRKHSIRRPKSKNSDLELSISKSNGCSSSTSNNNNTVSRNVKLSFNLQNASKASDGSGEEFQPMNEKGVFSFYNVCIESLQQPYSEVYPGFIRHTEYKVTKRIVVYDSHNKNNQTKQVIRVSGTYNSQKNYWTIHFSNQTIPAAHQFNKETAFFITIFCPGNLHHFWVDEFAPLFSTVRQTGRLKRHLQNILFYREPVNLDNQTIQECTNVKTYQQILSTLYIKFPHRVFYEAASGTCYSNAVFGVESSYLKNPRDAVEHVTREIMNNVSNVQQNATNETCDVLLVQRRTRKILNYDELVNISISLGFRNVCQIGWVRKTKIMVGVNGAALQWSIFMAPASNLVEISWPKQNWKFYYADHVKAYNIGYHQVVASHVYPNWSSYERRVKFRKLSEEEKKKMLAGRWDGNLHDNFWKWADIVVDVQQFRDVLKQFIRW
ncbi:hypothetical protein HELRODRAFT_191982 [Helobdella robusta]|uniref:Uncharacterized protein n=1 Tax=Helobdella robusta TaxID=6412 RepID=T1FTH4_HELRO|nr:hypothetical protein HELRODRAFT_191982 [Helobdella robusta]ESO03271.1 hypothetical protein HELRODRAFT_191982 [Helobdella robusta]